MISLFARDRAWCEWCGSEHPADRLCGARPGLTRRSFLFLAGAATGLALVDPASLLTPAEAAYRPTTISESLMTAQRLVNDWDSILKDVYVPAIAAQMNEPNTLVRFMSMSPAELEAHDLAVAFENARYRADQRRQRLSARMCRMEAYGVSARRLQRERARMERAA